MQNGPDFDKLIEPFIEIYQNVELNLIKHIASHFKLYEDIGFKNSMEWYSKKTAELGGLTQESIEIISKETKISKKKIVDMLKEAGISVIDLNVVDKLNNLRDFKIDVDTLVNSQPFLNIINNSYHEISDIFKLINTKAIEGSSKAYMDVLNEAYIEVRSGAFDYNTSIRRALTNMANKGIKVASYKQKSGKVINYDIESCVRRDILTAVVQCTNNSSSNFANEMQAEYYEVSQHLGARDTGTHDYKDHSWWQGKVYKIDGSTKEYPNFQETCNEGNVQGIGGANCRHIKWAFFPGISVPKNINIDPEENKRIYELNQQQRVYERTIRDYKRQIEVAKASDDVEKYNLYKDKLKTIDSEYNDFCKENNLKRRFSREYIAESIQNDTSFVDITNQWLKNADLSYQETVEATSVIKNNRKFKTNEINIIEYKNHEKENGEWFVSKFGGRIEYLPTIYQDGGISCADYKYYFKRNRKEWIFLEEKETSGKGKNVFYHALEDKEDQANIFLIDCTKSKFTNKEIRERLQVVFKSKKTSYVKTIIVKNNDDLFGVFNRK